MLHKLTAIKGSWLFIERSCYLFMTLFLLGIQSSFSKTNIEDASDPGTTTNYVKIEEDSARLNVNDLINEETWNTLFPYRFGAKDTGGGVWVLDPKDDFYTFTSFVEAINRMSTITATFERRCGTNAYRVTRTDEITGVSKIIRTDADFDAPRNTDKEIVSEVVDYGSFLEEGDLETRKREIAAFFANISHETTGGWATAPGGRFSWGLHFREEPTTSLYASPDPNYPPTPGKSYKGRGPMQLSYNYNYGPASEFIFGDKKILLDNPEKVIEDAALAFQTAIWFWMTPQYPKPSAHDVMVRNWTPRERDLAKNRLQGLGMTVNIINGGVECGTGTEKPQVVDRIGYYERFAGIYGIGTDMDGVHDLSDCGCKDMTPYGGDATDLTDEPCANKPKVTFASPRNNQIIEQTTFSAVQVSLSVDKKNTELSSITTTIEGQNFTGESFTWTPIRYGTHELTTNASFANGTTASSTITVLIWDGGVLNCGLVQEWSATVIYRDKDSYVKYNNKVYKNRWYADSSNIPGNDEVWTFVADCGTDSNIAPTVSWEAPSAGQTIEQTQLSAITLRARATDTDGNVQSFVFKHNNENINAVANGSTYTANFTPSSFGTYSLIAAATDDKGATTERTITFIVKEKTVVVNTPPSISDIDPQNASTIEQTTLTPITLKAIVTDDKAVNSVTFTVNNSTISTSKNGNQYTANWTPTAFGSVTFKVMATDNENESSDTTVTFTVKEKVIVTNTPPTISGIDPQNTATIEQENLTAIVLSAIVTDDKSVDNVTFTVNNTTVTTSKNGNQYSANWTPTAFGDVTFKVMATDNENASSETSVTFTIKEKVTGGNCDGINGWSADQIYTTKGTKVSYNGKIYANEWWTQGDIPGTSSVWKFVSNCDGNVSTDFCGFTPWASAIAYDGGDQVYYEQKIYKAKWWTQNNTPGTSNVWDFVSDCTSDLSSKSTKAYTLFPTVARNYVNFKIHSNTTSEIQVFLYDFAGKQVSSKSYKRNQKGNSSLRRYDISNLKQGVYIFKIIVDRKQYIDKIIKQ